MAKKSFKEKLDRAMSTFKSEYYNFGFSDVDLWANAGNYTLNWRLSGDFKRAYRFGRSVVVAGEPGSGKSLHLAYTCANAQKELNAHIVWLDVEKASCEEWLQNAGVNMDNLSYARVGTIDEVLSIISLVTTDLRADYLSYREGKGDAPTPVIIVIDSYSALMTTTEAKKATDGDRHADQGQQAKQLGSLIKQVTHTVDNLPVLILGTTHIYTSQDDYGEKQKVTGGIKLAYMASYLVKMNLKKLTAEEGKENTDADKDDKKKKIRGITSVVEIAKSRFSKPFEKVSVHIPYDKGMDPYSGLYDLMVALGVVKKSGAWNNMVDLTGKKHTFYAKDFNKYADMAMEIVNKNDPLANVSVGVDEEETDPDAESSE